MVILRGKLQAFTVFEHFAVQAGSENFLGMASNLCTEKLSALQYYKCTNFTFPAFGVENEIFRNGSFRKKSEK